MIKNFLNWIKNLFSPKKEEKEVVELTNKQQKILKSAWVSAWDIIQANSGGHKCITNISGLNFFSRATRDSDKSYKKQPGQQTKYVKMVKWIQNAMVQKLREYTQQ